MDNVRFSAEAFAALGIEVFGMLALPIALLIIWKRKTKASIVPVIAGAVVFPVFALVLKAIPSYFLMQSGSELANTVMGNVWLQALVGGLLAGIFEESGRFVAFKVVLKKYGDRADAISYGIGHGGFECIFLGFNALVYIFLGVLINSGNGGLLVAGADEYTVAAAAAQMSAIGDMQLGVGFIAIWERAYAMMLHLSLSVLVFAAAKKKGFGWMYPLAILLHSLVDFSIGFYLSGVISSLVVLELVMTALSAACAVLAFRVYKTIPAPKQEPIAE